MPLAPPRLRATSRRAHQARGPIRVPPAPRDNPDFEDIKPRPRRPSKQLTSIELVDCFYHTAGLPLRVAWDKCQSPEALLALCVALGVDPRFIVWAAFECGLRHADEMPGSYGPTSIQIPLRRYVRIVNAMLDGNLDQEDQYGPLNEQLGFELNREDDPLDRSNFVQEDLAARRVTEPLAVTRLFQACMYVLGGRWDLRGFPSQAQVFLDDSSRHWRSFRKEDAATIRKVIPWEIVAVRAAELKEDLGEPLWYSLIANLLPPQPRAHERVAQQVSDHAREIEGTARSIVAQDIFPRLRAEWKAGGYEDGLRLDPLRGYVAPHL